MSGYKNVNLLEPPEYDPRRLFPFGLSPIPEVPSELASEVSSICASPAPTELTCYGQYSEEEESDESDGSGSIMYSGSCSSVKSNGTLTGSGNGSSSSSQDHSSEATSSSDDECDEEEEDEESEESDGEKSVTRRNENDGLVPGENNGSLNPGAVTASEIFRHLQATREKEEVTSELAKILDVLQTTLQDEEEDEKSSDEEEEPSRRESPRYKPHSPKLSTEPMPTGKPPIPPVLKPTVKNPKFITQEISDRIKELQTPKKYGNAKEEMSILSKILVTLLCSCKSAAATEELKRIIRQFKDAAREASDGAEGELTAPSSRHRRRRRRTVSSSGGDADSSNTLTPNNTDSCKSSEDEGNYRRPLTPPPPPPLPSASNCSDESSRLKLNLQTKEIEQTTNVSFVISLPPPPTTVGIHRNSEDPLKYEIEDEKDCDWEDEDEEEVSKSEENASSNSVNKLLSEMECGAYNSAESLGSPHASSNSHASPGNARRDITPNLKKMSETNFSTSYEDDEEDEENVKKYPPQDDGKQEILFNHLEETFRVLNGTYRIITGTNNRPEKFKADESSSKDGSFEDVLNALSSQASNLRKDFEFFKEGFHKDPSCNNYNKNNDKSLDLKEKRPNSTLKTPAQRSRPPSRSTTKSRPCSAASRATSRQSNTNDDEDWEWEYYYENDEEDEELRGLSPATITTPTTRATSPFPIDEPAKRNWGVGNSIPIEDEQTHISPIIVKRADLVTPAGVTWEEVDSQKNDPSKASASIQIHNSEDTASLNPAVEVSVALAAEYLGRKAEEVVASLPANLFERKLRNLDDGKQGFHDREGKRRKKKKKKKRKREDEEEGYKGVKNLINKLEPMLFQDRNLAGTKMILTEQNARIAINQCKSENIKKSSTKFLRSGQHKMTVIQGTSSTTVTLRNKQRLHSPVSPTESEAYGTGSTGGSVNTENSVLPPQEVPTLPMPSESRHSRLLKIIQDSDYTDSEESIREHRISLKGVDDLISKESDMESLSSFDGEKQKNSIRSQESENAVRSRKFLLQRPESTTNGSELSTPTSSSPIPRGNKKRSGVWSFLQGEFDSSTGNIESSDTTAESPQFYSHNHSNHQIKCHNVRISAPITSSPKLEMELQELAYLPSAPGLNIGNLGTLKKFN